MRDERIILSPGPVHVPESALEDIRPLHHRMAEFRDMLRETEAMMRELLATEASVYAITASGTGGMEFAVANCTSPGTRVLAVSGGKFGDRWAEICRAYGCEIDHLRFPEGKAIDTGAVCARADSSRPEIVTITHVESSTGLVVRPDVVLRSLTEPRPLIFLDAIASAGVEDLAMDAWGIDVVVTASQKAFGAPAGMSFVAVGERARAKRTAGRGYYFDLDRYEQARIGGDTPFTPAIQTLQIVHRSLTRMRRIGWGVVRHRHRCSSDSWMAACRHLGLEPYPETPSGAVQVILLPTDYKLDRFPDRLMRRGGIIVADGQGKLAGKVFRTGFLGLHGGGTLRRAVSSIASVLEEGGCQIDRQGAEREIGSISDQGELF